MATIVTGQIIVTADDTTGALEAAAACADVGWPTTMVPFVVAEHGGSAVQRDSDSATVVDLGSRHMSGEDAATRVRWYAASSQLRAHKIDSTLRGNWSAEVAAIVAGGRRVLMIPAYPSAGRCCVDGVVYIDGVRVSQTAHGRDPRSPVSIDRPAESLANVVELKSVEAVTLWLEGDASIAVADANADAQVHRLVASVVDHTEVVVVGPASVVAGLARALAAVGLVPSGRAPAPIAAPVLVVSGSVHPASQLQMAALCDAGAAVIDLDDRSTWRPRWGTASVVVLTIRSRDAADDPEALLGRLGTHARRLLVESAAATVVLIGGDTAAAVLGSAAVVVEGTLATGVAIGSTTIDGRLVRVVSKPGGFGSPTTLVDLMSEHLHPMRPQ